MEKYRNGFKLTSCFYFLFLLFFIFENVFDLNDFSNLCIFVLHIHLSLMNLNLNTVFYIAKNIKFC